MARKKADAETAGEATPATAEKVTKADAVRAALADGADSPTDGMAYIKAKFGIDITPAHFSSYKSQIKAQAGKAPDRRGRAPRAEATPAPATAPSAPKSNGSIGVAGSVEAIKSLVEKYGVDEVVSLARLFGK